MSEYKPSLDEFLKDISTHRVEVLLDQGIYRHLRCRRVEEPTWLHWFDIHTGPNFLLIRGDMGSVCFSRVEDMFTFFASDPAKINASYWAEKIEGLPHGGTCIARKFDGDRFKEALVESLERYGLNGDLRRRVVASLDSEIEWCDDESFVRRQVDDFELDGFSFVDTFEVDSTAYLFHYIWLIRAICWAIGRYREMEDCKAFSAAAAEVAS